MSQHDKKLKLNCEEFINTTPFLCNIYPSSNPHCYSGDLENLAMQLQKSFILPGDLNCHESFWGSTRSDCREGILQEWIGVRSQDDFLV